MSDIAQMLTMFIAGAIPGGLLALVLATRSDRGELQRLIDGQPARPIWQRSTTQPQRRQAGGRRYAFAIPSATGGGPDANPQGAPGHWEVTQATPHRDPTRESDLLVPLGQAFVTATLLTLVVLAVCLLALQLPWQDVLRGAGILWPAALLAAWAWRLGIVTSLLAEVETIAGRDLSGDGIVGQPDRHAVLLDPGRARAAVAEERERQQDAGDAADLLRFVDVCYSMGTSENAHAVRPNTAGRERYLRMRDVLMQLGIAEWRNPERPTAGWQMVVSHNRALQILADHVGEI